MLAICMSFVLLALGAFKISLKSLLLVVCFSAIHFFAIISEVINSPDYAHIVLLRFVAILICTILLNLDRVSINIYFKSAIS